MWYLSRKKKRFIYFSAEKYSHLQWKEFLILNTSDLAFFFFFCNSIFNINLLGLGEVILRLLRLSNPVFIHLEKISVHGASQRKQLGPPMTRYS